VKNAAAMKKLITFMAKKIESVMKDVDYIAGLEARGFIFGPLIAAEMNKGFIPLRKKGKLPGEKIFVEYKLEYGSDVIEMQADSLHKGARVVIVDDLIGIKLIIILATGGTAMGAAQLIEKGEGVVAGYAFIIELKVC
jgi:adenine phosphoribosyltransferase